MSGEGHGRKLSGGLRQTIQASSIQEQLRRKRRSIRLSGYDYSQAGAYFVTICTQNRACLFGGIIDGEMVLNNAGRIVCRCWEDIPIHFPHVELDEFVVMPNHVHGIVVIYNRRCTACRGTACRAPTVEQFGKPVRGSLSTIIRSFKSAVTKQINEMQNTPGAKLWQRGFWEHIVRDETGLNRIRQYIINNPAGWEHDLENPHKDLKSSLPTAEEIEAELSGEMRGVLEGGG